MLGETTFGTYVFHGALSLLLLVMVGLFLRYALMFSLLLVAPIAAVLRRIRGIGR